MPASESTTIQVVDSNNSELGSNHCYITGISTIYYDRSAYYYSITEHHFGGLFG